MLHQLFIKLFLLVFVINPLILGVCFEIDLVVYLGLFNLLASIIFLFQHSKDIKAITPENKRAFFSPSVFFIIAFIVGGIAWHRGDPALWDLFHVSAVWGAVGMGLFFYVGSYIVFRMNSQFHGWKGITKLLFAGLMILTILRLAGLLRVGYDNGAFKILYSTELRERIEQSRDNALNPQNTGTTQDSDTQQPDDLNGEDTSDEDTNDEDTNNEDTSDENADEADDDAESTADSDDSSDSDETNESDEATDTNDNESDTTTGGIDTPVTYASLIPWIVERYELPASDQEYTFQLVSPDAPNYDDFVIARSRGMVGSNINPDREVRCQNLMVIVGLAEGWSIDGSIPVLDAYWNVAQERGYTQYCSQRNAIATTNFYTDVATP